MIGCIGLIPVVDLACLGARLAPVHSRSASSGRTTWIARAWRRSGGI
jgi:hypothetical protein